MSASDSTIGSGVDVVVATRNSEAFLKECLTSIAAQGLANLGVTIVDDSSTDATMAIASEMEHVMVVRQTGRGLAQAWNQGMQAGSREFIAIIDSDDAWSPGFVQACLSSLEDAPDAMLVTARVRFLLDSEELPNGFRRELVSAEPYGWMPGTSVFRRSLLEHVGYFPEDFDIASDIEWFARVREAGLPVLQLPMVGLYKRIHGDNLSLSGTDPAIYRHEVLRVAKARIKRHLSVEP